MEGICPHKVLKEFQFAEFKADITVSPTVPHPFSIRCRKFFQGMFGTPDYWIEMNLLSEVSKPKTEGSKAQHTRLGFLKNSVRQSYAGKPTSLMNVNPIQVKFM